MPFADRRAVADRLAAWFAAVRDTHLGPLMRVATLGPAVSPAARGLIVRLVETMGCLLRADVGSQVEALTRADRKALVAAGVRIGVVHVFIAAALRPEPTRWRLALWAVAAGHAVLPAPPSPGLVTIDVVQAVPPAFYAVAGFWAIGASAVRIDMVDRLARAMHGQRDGRTPFVPDANWIASVGMGREAFARLMRALGYRPRLVDGAAAFAWGGIRAEPRRPEPDAPSDSPFAVLKQMKGR